MICQARWVSTWRVTFSAWNGAAGAGKPAASRTVAAVRAVLGMTAGGVSGDETPPRAQSAYARDCGGLCCHDSAKVAPVRRAHGAVYRCAAVAPVAVAFFKTGPIYVADKRTVDWNCLSGSGRRRAMMYSWSGQGGGTARTRLVSFVPAAG